MKLERLLAAKLRDFKYEHSDTGIRFDNGIALGATYTISQQGHPDLVFSNLVPMQGLNTWLNILLGGTSKIANWYLAPFAGNVSPSSSWTASNFADTATEFTNYTESNRQTIVLPSSAVDGEINNYASRAVITIGPGTGVDNTTIWGAAALSVAGKESQSGFILSASKSPAAKQNLLEGEQLTIGFSMSLSNAS